MKIDSGAAARQAYAAYQSKGVVKRDGGAAAASDDGAAPVGKADHASISPDARLKARALDAAHAAPPARAERVADLRAQVQAGTFKVDDDSLARSLARHIDVRA